VKRTVADVIRRGFDSAAANWPVLMLRVAEAIVMMTLALGAIVALVIPVAISIGLSKESLSDAASAAEAIRSLVTGHWMILVYLAMLVTAALFAFTALHAFVQAGSARIFVDAERAAGEGTPHRRRYAVFSMERWLAGGRAGWWAVFWIYNIAWFFASLVILVPAIVTLALMLLLRESAAAIVAGCAGLVLIVFVLLLTGIVTSVVTTKAIVVCLGRGTGAADSLSEAWGDIRADFGRHFAVALILLVISLGGSATIAAVSMLVAAPGSHSMPIAFALLPLRLALSLVSSVFSAAVMSWWFASFAALEGK
jgi:hypothetical protein